MKNEFLICQGQMVTIADLIFLVDSQLRPVTIGLIAGIQIHRIIPALPGDQVHMAPTNGIIIGYEIIHIASFLSQAENCLIDINRLPRFAPSQGREPLCRPLLRWVRQPNRAAGPYCWA